MKIHKFQLKNDLKVITVQSRKSPVVSVQMWVRTGSADEGKGEEGISHFIEHLVFKGTDKFKVGEIAATVEGSGGELNAYTSFDQTVFYVTISKEYTKTALEVISQMMGHPKFDEEEIDNEREVVIEEIKRSEDSLHRQASRKLFEGAYRKHPYGIPVIGYTENIKRFTKKQILDYYNRRYTPENMTLLIVGDFEPNELKQDIKSYFAQAVSYKTKKSKRAKEPQQLKPRIQFVEGPFEETLMHMAWKIPPVKHKDTAALEVLSMILGSGESSRLTMGLTIKNPVTNYCGASAFTPKDSGFFAISASLKNEKIGQAFEELHKQLKDFLSDGPTEEELERVKLNIECGELYSLETVDGLARKYGQYNDLFQDPEYHKKWLKQIQALTLADVYNVAKKYLTPKTQNTVLISKKRTKEMEEAYKKFQKAYSKTFLEFKNQKFKFKTKSKKALVKWSPSKKEKEMGVVQLSSGAQFIYYVNSDSPVVSSKFVWLGGQRAEPEGGTGITELLSRSWISDSEGLSEEDLHKRLNNLSSHLGAFGGKNTLGTDLTCLTSFLKPSFDILEKIISAPLFSDEVLRREVALIEEQIKNRADNPSQVCMRQLAEALFEKHPYGYDPLGKFSDNKGAVAEISSQEISDHLTRLKASKNLSVVMVGDIDVKEWMERLEQFTSKLPRGEKFNKIFTQKNIEKDIKLYKASQKEQNHIAVAFRGLTLGDENRYVLQVIQSILAGQGGRLFLELRDKESLAYSVSPMRMEGIEKGYVGAYIACSPEKSEKALDMLFAEFKKLQDIKVSEEELIRAQKYLIGRHDIDLQKNSSLAASLVFDQVYGIPYDETFKYSEKIHQVTSERVRNLAEQIFSQKSVISVVGSKCPW